MLCVYVLIFEVWVHIFISHVVEWISNKSIQEKEMGLNILDFLQLIFLRMRQLLTEGFKEMDTGDL